MGGDNGWISVDERLPPMTEPVLLRHGDLCVEGYLRGVHSGRRPDWRSPYGGQVHMSSGVLTGVTHWRPLPEHPAPPKDPADEELEGILGKLMASMPKMVAPDASRVSMDLMKQAYATLLADTIAEIKAWRDKEKAQ